MSSKTTRRRARRRKATGNIPELAETPRREATGRKQRRTATQDGEDKNAADVVLRARARHMASDKVDEMRDVALVDAAGRALNISLGADKAKPLTALYAAYIGTYGRYMRRCIGLSPDPKVAKLEMMPNRMETRADDRPDLRTEDERDRDAANAWAVYRIAFAKLSLRDRQSINIARQNLRELTDMGQVTGPGARFVLAMRNFAKLVD